MNAVGMACIEHLLQQWNAKRQQSVIRVGGMYMKMGPECKKTVGLSEATKYSTRLCPIGSLKCEIAMFVTSNSSSHNKQTAVLAQSDEFMTKVGDHLICCAT